MKKLLILLACGALVLCGCSKKEHTITISAEMPDEVQAAFGDSIFVRTWNEAIPAKETQMHFDDSLWVADVEIPGPVFFQVHNADGTALSSPMQNSRNDTLFGYNDDIRVIIFKSQNPDGSYMTAHHETILYYQRLAAEKAKAETDSIAAAEADSVEK